ncbi:MAG: 4-alpha-glucanotransferase, partial [Alistipes sp.]|nr:4-alpha-glucanotransferase [Candidatus Minthomonas equi]
VLAGFLNSPSMLAIFPIQDWLAADKSLRRTRRDAERINQPANPNHHWCFRLHIPLEKLISDEGLPLVYEIRTMISDSGRLLKTD